MAFDLISWVIGYGLKKTANTLTNEMFSQGLSKQLNSEVENWAKELPEDYSVYPEALFFYSNQDKFERPSFNEIRNKLNTYEIPEKNEWLEVFTEQWNFVNKTIDNPQPFFQHDIETVIPFLNDLAKRVETVVTTDSKYFIKELRKRFDSLEEKISWINDPNSESISDNLIEPNDTFDFSNHLVRSIYVDPLTNRLHRQFRFRIKLKDNQTTLYNLNLNLYLIITRIVTQPDNTIGYSKNWHRLNLKERSNYIPKLSNYWSINYSIDPKLNEPESPFFRYKDHDSIVDAKIRIYINCENEKGIKKFAEWEYEWSKESTIFGRFRLRNLIDGKMTNKLLNDIIEIDNDNYEWPLFDIKRIGDK